MLKLLISDYEVALETEAGQGGEVNEADDEWDDEEDVNDLDMISAMLAGQSVLSVCACVHACVCKPMR